MVIIKSLENRSSYFHLEQFFRFSWLSFPYLLPLDKTVSSQFHRNFLLDFWKNKPIQTRKQLRLPGHGRKVLQKPEIKPIKLKGSKFTSLNWDKKWGDKVWPSICLVSSSGKSETFMSDISETHSKFGGWMLEFILYRKSFDTECCI